MNQIAEDILMHYGMPRRSGRYPWGSGDNPYQHSGDFLSRVEELKKQGLSEKEIADSFGLTTTQFRTQKSLAKNERRALEVATAKGLREKGYSLNEIAEKMGYTNDSSIRSLLNESSESNMNQAQKTADFLRKQIDEKGMIDVGTGVERELGISKEKLNQALYILEMEGYPVYGGGVTQVTFIFWKWKAIRYMVVVFLRLLIPENRQILKLSALREQNIRIFMITKMFIH